MLAVIESPETIPLENDQPDGPSLIEVLCGSLVILWKDWPRAMRLTVLEESSFKFSLNGECPHCRDKSVFMPVGSPFIETLDKQVWRVCSAMRCQGCLRFVLGAVLRRSSEWDYAEHYPLGSPDDSVDKSVPKGIAADFAEALRCLWVKSFKAAVAMCRRSVEAACKDLGATGKDLYSMIEDLAQKDIITEPMRRMAHRVRLTANRKLHEKPGGEKLGGGEIAEADDLDSMIEKDANAMIAFTKEFFHHIYSIMEMLKTYEEKPQGEAATAEIDAETKDLLGI